MSTQRYAVLGHPVKHSLSPAMHNAAFAACGIDASYEAIEVTLAELPAMFARLKAERYAGWNCTVPHKERAAGLVDEVAPAARPIGCINTILNRDGHLLGDSTDGYGLLTAVQEAFGLDPRGCQVALIGCGGAGRTVAFALAQAGVRRLALLNRTIGRARTVAAELAVTSPACEVVACGLKDPDVTRAALAGATLIIQATSAGLRPDDECPVDPFLLPTTAAVYDMIYRQTPLLQAAAARGCRVADGLAMLLHQGARSFTLWTGQPAPIEVMRAALLKARP